MEGQYVQFLTPVLLVGIFMWMWRELRQQRNYIDARFDKLINSIDARFDEVEKQFEKVDKRFDKVGARIGNLEAEMHAEFRVFNQSMNELTSRSADWKELQYMPLAVSFSCLELKNSSKNPSLPRATVWATICRLRKNRNPLECCE